MKHKVVAHIAVLLTMTFLGTPGLAWGNPLPRPPISLLQAATIADRELQTRGMATDSILRTVTFVRAPEIAASFYVAVIDPLEEPADSGDAPSARKYREFRIDMHGVATFREVEGKTTRKRVEP